MVAVRFDGSTDPVKPKPKATVVKRTTKRKPKDKPKRPLSAYNFFFKEERENIIKIVLSDDPKSMQKDVDPDDDTYLDEETINRLKKEGGKVSFEEMGKIIGQRWKNINPDLLSKYSELASGDTDRYKKAMKDYNGKQEAKMRIEASKPPSSSSYSTAPSSSSSTVAGPTPVAGSVVDNGTAHFYAADGRSNYGDFQGSSSSYAGMMPPSTMGSGGFSAYGGYGYSDISPYSGMPPSVGMSGYSSMPMGYGAGYAAHPSMEPAPSAYASYGSMGMNGYPSSGLAGYADQPYSTQQMDPQMQASAPPPLGSVGYNTHPSSGYGGSLQGGY